MSGDRLHLAMAELARQAGSQGTPPSASLIWWKAELRRRREARERPLRMMTRIQTVIVGAAAAGLALGVAAFWGALASWPMLVVAGGVVAGALLLALPLILEAD